MEEYLGISEVLRMTNLDYFKLNQLVEMEDDGIWGEYPRFPKPASAGRDGSLFTKRSVEQWLELKDLTPFERKDYINSKTSLLTKDEIFILLINDKNEIKEQVELDEVFTEPIEVIEHNAFYPSLHFD